ncbi:hypothetical protein [Celerinatantimonas sp. MCCC 1A17872]|uniref:hypothetical protein n=1 Tax=Celerinatantimonas sp. MCCC 1A17872 TaxID=3177514 RepID=UPI0038BE5335
MQIEKLLAKFGLTAVRYGDGTGGKGLLSLDEQLAAVGITWHQSNAGFLLLIAQCNNDKRALNDLMHLVYQMAAQLFADHWRGFCPKQAVTALCVTAVAIALHEQGRQCDACHGTGKVKRYRKQVKCQNCVDGYIPWDKYSIYSAFNEQLPITFDAFESYRPYVDTLVEWIANERTTAFLAMEERMQLEIAEARLVA